jgi:YVTN family beta-propeller protein
MRSIQKTGKLLSLLAFATATLFTACKKDDPAPPASGGAASGSYSNGVFVTNEGPFGSGTGTVSFYDRGTGAVSNDIFEAKNGYPLGNIVQSMEIYNGSAYIVVNNAGKIEVANASDFASSGSITGFTYPRFFMGITASKGYVTEWGAGGVSGAVKVVDLSSKTITATITTGKGAESMLMTGAKVYVACGGGFDNDSVVTVIDPATNSVLTSIVAGANPKNIKLDANGKLWVLCSGKWDPTYSFLEKTGSLVRINPATNAVELSLPFSSLYSQPSSLVINSAGTTLYYSYNGGVYSQSCASSSLSAAPAISRSFYGLGVDPVNNYLYASDAADFVSNGKVFRYNSSLALVDSFAVGVIPGNFYFK